LTLKERERIAANLYVQSHREWDERYADLVVGKRNWQITAGGLLVATLILSTGIVWRSTRSRYVPYVVEVDKLGHALTVPRALSPRSVPALIDCIERYEIATFIRNARSVSSDVQVEQQALDSLLAHARGAASRFLGEYYRADDFARNPFKLSAKQTVSVQIDSILKLSEQSYQVHWSETRRDLNGAVMGMATHWEAVLQVESVPPDSDDAIVLNPLGLYVTQITWTQTDQPGLGQLRKGGITMRYFATAGTFVITLGLGACAAKQPPAPPPLKLVTQDPSHRFAGADRPGQDYVFSPI
jgi:type IV secretion system protein TrbF